MNRYIVQGFDPAGLPEMSDAEIASLLLICAGSLAPTIDLIEASSELVWLALEAHRRLVGQPAPQKAA